MTMHDLMTSRGRAAMLRQIEPNWREIGDQIENHAMPVVRSIQQVSPPTWAKIGGGVLVIAAVAAAFQFFMGPSQEQRQTRSQTQRAKPRRASVAPTRRAPARKPAANGRAAH